MAPPTMVIRPSSPSDLNSLNGVQVIGNQLIMTGPGRYPAEPVGINIANGDAASDDGDPSLFPIQYSENDVASNIAILSNTISGANFGIEVQESCCGNRNNTLSGLSIVGNTMTGIVDAGVVLASGSSGGYYSRSTTADVLSGVLIQSNTIQMTPAVFNGCNCFPGGLGIALGGIQVWAGVEEPGNSVNGLTILNNDVNTPLVGISIIAGQSHPPNAPIFPPDNNVVSATQISCNQVDQAATVAVAPYSGIKGINVVAGMINASGNQVQKLVVENNLVGGVLNRSEEHTSELQSLRHLVCRLLLEKKKQTEKTQQLLQEDCRSAASESTVLHVD